MNDSKKTAQTDYLRACLQDSYFTLLQEKPAEKISVSEIVKLAGISRMSFYRYCENKDDIIRQFLEDSFKKYMAVVDEESVKNSLEAATLFFGYFRSNRVRMRALIDQGLFHLLFESFPRFLQVSNLSIESTPDIPQQYREYYYEYASGGLLNLAKAWVATGMKDSDREMAQALRKIKKVQGR